jgi:hypothetical protein
MTPAQVTYVADALDKYLRNPGDLNRNLNGNLN